MLVINHNKGKGRGLDVREEGKNEKIGSTNNSYDSSNLNLLLFYIIFSLIKGLVYIDSKIHNFDTYCTIMYEID